MDLTKKVALVTGASRGIGAATAIKLASLGASVCVNYYSSSEAADKVVSQIRKAGGTAIAARADVRNRDEIDAMVEKTQAELGAIDILILNAGMPVPFKAFDELSYGEFETKVMGELAGFFHPLQAVIPSMKQRKSGRIVGISSGLSRKASHGFSAHTTVKSGIDGLMKSLAFELGPYGIRVNTLAPGLTRTDATAWLSEEQIEAMAAATPLRRIPGPEQVADAVALLVLDEASFLTGNYISTSGGELMV